MAGLEGGWGLAYKAEGSGKNMRGMYMSSKNPTVTICALSDER